ncbi:MAG: hypothetical protein JWM15_2667, partial [Cryptosporangiaceae bacterium]|nr:hypothetical protein [Cryptosporangiaceae bacterium]
VLAERRRRESERLAERRTSLVAAGFGPTGFGPAAAPVTAAAPVPPVTAAVAPPTGFTSPS